MDIVIVRFVQWGDCVLALARLVTTTLKTGFIAKLGVALLGDYGVVAIYAFHLYTLAF